MAGLVMDVLTRRRVARAEAEGKAMAAVADAELEDDGASGLPPTPPRFIPRCCWEGLAEGAPPHYPIEVLRDVDYSCDADCSGGPHSRNLEMGRSRLRLDIYYSPGALRRHARSQGNERVPVTLHVHGGGWQRGSKASEWRGGPNAGRASARHGLVACVVSYRLHHPGYLFPAVWVSLCSLIICAMAAPLFSWLRDAFLLRWALISFVLAVLVSAVRWWDRTKVRHPESVLDVAMAVGWVRAHLAEHVPAADPSRLFLTGHSAGAHIVSLLATDPRYMRAVGLPPPSTVLRGVCAVSGIFHLHAPVAPSPGHFRNYFFRWAYTSAFGSGKDALDDASPLKHASADAPPFLLISASSDLGLEIDAERFARRLEELGVPVSHHVVLHTSHSTIASHFEQHQAHRHLFQFIERCCSTEAQPEGTEPTQEPIANSSINSAELKRTSPPSRARRIRSTASPASSTKKKRTVTSRRNSALKCCER